MKQIIEKFKIYEKFTHPLPLLQIEYPEYLKNEFLLYNSILNLRNNIIKLNGLNEKYNELKKEIDKCYFTVQKETREKELIKIANEINEIKNIFNKNIHPYYWDITFNPEGWTAKLKKYPDDYDE